MREAQWKTLDTLRTILQALGNQFQPGDQLAIDGKRTTVAQLMADLEATAASFEAERLAHIDWQSARKARDVEVAGALAQIAGLKTALQARFGKKGGELFAFGFGHRPRTQPSVATLAIAGAKARRTRELRGTRGKRQRAAITVEGTAGLVLLQPDGTPVPGVLQGPTAPAKPKK